MTAHVRCSAVDLSPGLRRVAPTLAAIDVVLVGVFISAVFGEQVHREALEADEENCREAKEHHLVEDREVRYLWQAVVDHEEERDGCKQ